MKFDKEMIYEVMQKAIADQLREDFEFGYDSQTFANRMDGYQSIYHNLEFAIREVEKDYYDGDEDKE